MATNRPNQNLNQSQKPCRFHNPPQSTCRFGADCKFSHASPAGSSYQQPPDVPIAGPERGRGRGGGRGMGDVRGRGGSSIRGGGGRGGRSRDRENNVVQQQQQPSARGGGFARGRGGRGNFTPGTQYIPPHLRGEGSHTPTTAQEEQQRNGNSQSKRGAHGGGGRRNVNPNPSQSAHRPRTPTPPPPPPPPRPQTPPPPSPPPRPPTPPPPPPIFYSKILGGNFSVQFTSGMVVQSMTQLAITTSTITIENLPPQTSATRILALCNIFKDGLKLGDIRMQSNGTRAMVHFDEDPVAADNAVKCLHESFFENRELTVRALRPVNASQDVTRIECSWFPARAWSARILMEKPSSKEVVMRYLTTGNEKEPFINVLGKRIKIIPQNDSPRFSRNLPCSLFLGGLPPQTTTADIYRELVGVEELIGEIRMIPPKNLDAHTLTHTQIVRYLQRKFKVEREEDMRLTTVNNGEHGRQRAVFNYPNPEDAIAVYHRRRAKDHGEDGGDGESLFRQMELEYNLTYSVSFTIPARIWGATRDEIRKIEEAERIRMQEWKLSNQNRKGKGRATADTPGMSDLDEPARIVILAKRGPGAMVHVNGEGRESITKIKGAIRKLLSGHVVRDEDGKPLWDPALRGPEGQQLIRHVASLGVLVDCDSRSRRITLYGPEDDCEGARTTLMEQYKLLLMMQHIIRLDGNMKRIGARGGFAAVKALVGDEMAFVDHLGSRLIVRCSPADLLRVRTLLTQPQPREAQEAGQTVTNANEACPACISPAEEPVIRTSCGHAYCKECIGGFLRSALDTRTFPLRCFHDGGDTGVPCTEPLALHVITAALTPAEADQLFDASFAAHVQGQPGIYSYCPTPDCPTVYTASTSKPPIVTCPHCLAGICTSCKTFAHIGQTCRTYQNSIRGEDMFSEWKRAADVRSCPRCNIDIEKNEGCNHMSCRCGAHVCWTCMKAFPEGQIYDHMRNDCGGMYPADAEAARARLAAAAEVEAARIAAAEREATRLRATNHPLAAAAQPAIPRLQQDILPHIDEFERAQQENLLQFWAQRRDVVAARGPRVEVRNPYQAQPVLDDFFRRQALQQQRARLVQAAAEDVRLEQVVAAERRREQARLEQAEAAERRLEQVVAAERRREQARLENAEAAERRLRARMTYATEWAPATTYRIPTPPPAPVKQSSGFCVLM